jgi:hypothetical protein
MEGITLIRKRIFVSLLLLLPPLCFAQQNLINDIEFFSGMPFVNGIGENDKNESINFHSKNPSFSAGLGLTNYSLSKDKSIGLFFSIEEYYTKAFIYNLSKDSFKEEIIYNQGNITAENYQLGVKIQSFKAGNFKFPFMIGINVFSITASANPSAGVTWNLERKIVGTFASAAAELHFNESIFLFARLQATFTCLLTSTIIKYTEVEIVGSSKAAYYVDQYVSIEAGLYTTLTPVIGLGLKMNGLFGK